MTYAPLVTMIQDRVAAHYAVSKREMLSRRRPVYIIRPRQVAMYLARELTPRSLPEIGRCFGRDHTTVLSAIRKVERLRAEDPQLDRDVSTIEKGLGRMKLQNLIAKLDLDGLDKIDIDAWEAATLIPLGLPRESLEAAIAERRDYLAAKIGMARMEEGGDK